MVLQCRGRETVDAPMAVGPGALPVLHPVTGVKLGTACAGFKKPGRRDLVVISVDEGAACAAVFTRNAFCAAPVAVARRHLSAAAPRYLLINTGNANAGTGEEGIRAATACCDMVAEYTGCRREQVVPFSTGVIGENLPLQPFRDHLPGLLQSLDENGWSGAASGIMTTDTVAKGASLRTSVQGRPVTVTGIAKGSGMICPDMATMLAFVATDSRIEPGLLQECLARAAARSFNRITVDGDTSTNDACVLLATGKSDHAPVTSPRDDGFRQLCAAVTEVCETLARLIVRDGEGATKFICIAVHGGRSEEECRRAAYAVAHSPLVKTAFFASDPNWGRILAALGRSGLEELDVSRVNITLNGMCIVRGGARDPEYREQDGAAVMRSADITVSIELGRGRYTTEVWTCDLSYDYVRINAEYRS